MNISRESRSGSNLILPREVSQCWSNCWNVLLTSLVVPLVVPCGTWWGASYEVNNIIQRKIGGRWLVITQITISDEQRIIACIISI